MVRKLSCIFITSSNQKWLFFCRIVLCINKHDKSWSAPFYMRFWCCHCWCSPLLLSSIMCFHIYFVSLQSILKYVRTLFVHIYRIAVTKYGMSDRSHIFIPCQLFSSSILFTVLLLLCTPHWSMCECKVCKTILHLNPWWILLCIIAALKRITVFFFLHSN